jgi:hypothetical protein
VNVHHDDETRKTKNDEIPPSWRVKCRSGFTTLPPVPLQEQPVVVLLLEGHRSLGELAIREYGGHQDLRGSGHRSVIPYVHG